jgi:hypothetical protein
VKLRNDQLLSVVSGKMVCQSFSDIHEAIEVLAGGPVFTHQIPAWMRANEPRLREMFPDLAARDMTDLSAANAASWMDDRTAWLAEEREVQPIGGAPESPFDHLPEHLRGNVITVLKP